MRDTTLEAAPNRHSISHMPFSYLSDFRRNLLRNPCPDRLVYFLRLGQPTRTHTANILTDTPWRFQVLGAQLGNWNYVLLPTGYLFTHKAEVDLGLLIISCFAIGYHNLIDNWPAGVLPIQEFEDKILFREC